MTRRPWALAAMVLLTALGLGFLAREVVLRGGFASGETAPYEQLSASPRGMGTAILVADLGSLAGASAWVCVKDPARGSAPMLLPGSETASDGGVKMDRALWSRDGSVLAVRARIGQSAGKHFVGAFAVRYIAAYDFRRHTAVVAPGLAPPSGHAVRPQPDQLTPAFSHAVAALLRERGGEGKAVFVHPYSAEGTRVAPEEGLERP